eukprot:TRINITY_DN3221_c0_g1_i4.p2 TRINITY_DN3221_c0_g1~~TRINITY_DN3221_c0_g1_i4.p2  ORF type:complete len:118 (-),score=9.84 TRINITY_DN3221_c0_g1_i4:175-504(-)
MALQSIVTKSKPTTLLRILSSSKGQETFQQVCYQTSQADTLIEKLVGDTFKYNKIKAAKSTFIQKTTDEDGKPLYQVGVYAVDKQTSVKMYKRFFVNTHKALIDIAGLS